MNGAASGNVHASLGAQRHEIVTPQLQDSIRNAYATQRIQGGVVTVLHTPGDHVVCGTNGKRDIPHDGFISMGPGESVRDGTHDVEDAKNGLKIAAAIVFTALAAGTVGYLVDDMWFRNRMIGPWGGGYGGFGGYGYGMGGW